MFRPLFCGFDKPSEVPGKFPETFPCKILGPAFGRTDFSQIFNFEPPDFFADFLAGFFLLIFVGKSAQKNPPGKSSKIYTTKILQHISADCPGQKISRKLHRRASA